MMDNIMKELWVDKTLVLANEMVAASLLKAVDVMTAREQLKRHLRTTPEGFALVPVPEWVKVADGLPVVPEGESMINVWYAYKDFVGACPISRDGAWSLPSHATHWQHNYEPAPPKSERRTGVA